MLLLSDQTKRPQDSKVLRPQCLRACLPRPTLKPRVVETADAVQSLAVFKKRRYPRAAMLLLG